MEPFAQGPEAHVPAIHSGAGTDCGVVAKEKREGSGGRRVQRGQLWSAININFLFKPQLAHDQVV